MGTSKNMFSSIKHLQNLQTIGKISINQKFELGMLFYKTYQLTDALSIFLELSNEQFKSWEHFEEVNEMIDTIYLTPIGC